MARRGKKKKGRRVTAIGRRESEECPLSLSLSLSVGGMGS
jgi:hypothetical protein